MWVISGKESPETPIIFAGNGKNKNYIGTLAFDSSCNEINMGKIRRGNLPKIINKKYQDYFLRILEVNNTSHRVSDAEKGFLIPCWISQEADISVDTATLRKYEKQINKWNLQFEMTNERYQFDKFYNTMHLPYITKVYGNGAFLMPYENMKKNLKKCDLLLIKKDNEHIGGNLIIYEKDVPRLWSLGIKDGNTDYLKTGVTIAIDYFAIKYLKQKGYKKLNFGGTRAFLHDGVLQYKKRWGLQIVGSSKMGFLIQPLTKSVNVKNFFLRNPFIYIEEDKLNGAVFIESDQLCSQEDLKKIYKNYYVKGLSKLNIYLFGDNERNTGEIIPPELRERMSIQLF
ncbi:MAG: hypothetical protein BroJett041_11320 [Candidatus Jettenia caeni]|nr:MAG: hypothetical protein BroJett041_11320 [Candidatus Jettenia caeni]GJQ45974.1 MAG: hypothetical protein JETCAE04_17280 [Candidatus Jettenia caeni]